MAPKVENEKLKFLLVSTCLRSISGTTTSMQPPESANEPIFYKNNVCDSVVKEKKDHRLYLLQPPRKNLTPLSIS